MMTKHLQIELNKLREMLLNLCRIVEHSVIESVEAFKHQDIERANNVLKHDDDIDNLEIEIEEECLKILALHQPVAIDLRFIVAALKMNNDLERIGDQAVKISYKARDLATGDGLHVNIDIEPLLKITLMMLDDALESLFTFNRELAQKVCDTDDLANELKMKIRDETQDAIEKYPDKSRNFILVLGVARCLERISDLTTNIAEDVIYMIDGNIVRHRRDKD